MTNLLVLATEEGVPPEHIGSQIALPLGILFFCGSVFLLLWAIYGAKKGGLIYLTSFFAFNLMLGVFWWFGAPGTPVATGLQYFPGQSPDTYQGKWFAFEQGSERAEFFPVTNSYENFEPVPEHLGIEDPTPESLRGNEKVSFLEGDLDQATSRMLEVYLPTDETGTALLGGDRRAAVEERIDEGFDQVVDDLTASRTVTEAGEEVEIPGAVEDTIRRASPFLTARVAPREDGGLDRGLTEDGGTRVAAARVQLVAGFEGFNADERLLTTELVVEEDTLFAFKDPGALWFPSAIWTLISLIGFIGFAYLLDRMEQREKRIQAEEAEEPMEVTVGSPV